MWNTITVFLFPIHSTCSFFGINPIQFFTFVIPFGCVNYLPLLYVLGKPGASPFAALAPLAGFLFILPCALVWMRGVRRFRSTGS